MTQPQLYPFQERPIQETLDAFAAGQTAYIAYEQGLGKSRIAFEIMRRDGTRRALFICPASAAFVLAQEAEKVRAWWPDMPKVIVIGYKGDKLTKGDGIFILSYGLVSASRKGTVDYGSVIKQGEPFGITFLDEAHFLKSAKTVRTKLILSVMRPKLGRVVPMSGTPTPNHSGELFPILRTLAPHRIEMSPGVPMNGIAFENTYCVVNEKVFNGNRVRVIEGSKNTPELRKKLEGFILRKTKKEVLTQLPPMAFETVPVSVSVSDEAALEAYRDIVRPGMSDDEVLAALRRNEDAHVMRLRSAIGLSKVAGALEYLRDYLEDNPVQIVVWAHHRKVMDLLQEGLAEHRVVRLDGSTSQTNRAHAVNAFVNGQAQVFLGQIQAGGTAITLIGPHTRCSDAFFVEMEFTPGDNAQAAARIHRIGQRDAVLVRFFCAYGTLDSRIATILARKTQDFAELFDNEGATP
jgi:SWI/SNF-related matrix-associated actin-dependent regulator of chromatin subfamily A-like protein 1